MVTSARTTKIVIPEFVLKAYQKLPAGCGVSFAAVEEWKEDVQKAIVPVQPVMDCILIRLWAFNFGGLAQARAVAGPITIPKVVSKKAGSKTPLVDTMVRRSPRINPSAVDGFQIVKVKEPASKRRKKYGIQLNLKNPTEASEVSKPTSLESIREWAAACGVAPKELTDEDLLKGHDDIQE